MDKSLPAVRKNTQAALFKSKSLMNVTGKILINKTSLPQEIIEDWILALWEWADANNITNDVIPRDAKLLMLTTKLYITTKLTHLPEEIVNLVNLTEIHIRYSRLTEFPAWIGDLVNLTKIHICYNRLTKLPEEIGNLSQLCVLDLSFNELTELPAWIGDLVNLTELSLSKNNISELPEEIGNLSQLCVLNLHNNELTELPKEIGNLEKLTYLGLIHNHYLKVTGWLFNFVQKLEIRICDVRLGKEQRWIVDRLKCSKRIISDDDTVYTLETT